MSETSNQELLRQQVVEASIADTWDDAKLEWSLITIFDEPEGTCACGHEIAQHCVIRNKHNTNELIVGNVCINHFGVEELHVPAGARSSLRGIHQEVSTAHANSALLDVSKRLFIISEKESTDYESVTRGTGSRTRFQPEHANYDHTAVELVDKVNHLIVYGFRSDRPKCACGQFAKPRRNGTSKAYFYSCARFPNGCRWSQNL